MASQGWKSPKFDVRRASADPLVREAMRLATEERPGAVHLELPEDIAQETTDGVTLEPIGSRRPDASEDAIRDAIVMIEQARHPLLLIGAGANRKNTSRALTHFVDTTCIPFVNTQMGKGVIDERHPLFLGCAALFWSTAKVSPRNWLVSDIETVASYCSSTA